LAETARAGDAYVVGTGAPNLIGAPYEVGSGAARLTEPAAIGVASGVAKLTEPAAIGVA
jgi:hypothetical protein